MLESVQAAHDQPSWNGSSSETLEANRVDEQQRIEREKSHTSQNIDPDVVIVDWDGPNDPENPYVGVSSRTKLKLMELCKGSTGQSERNGFLHQWLCLEHSSPS